MILRTQRSLRLPVAAVVLGLISWACPVARTAEANPWQQLTRKDLAAVRQLVQENHPGPVDSEDPAFGTHLETDFAAACRAAEQARGYEDWLFALRFYAASFQDGHLEFGESVHRDTVRWPGFLVVYTGDGKYRVAGPEPGPPGAEERPPAGAELLSCDGRTPAQMMTADVLPYFGIRDLEASLFRYAPRLLVDEGNPAHSAPKTCRVRVGGDEKEYPLHWQAIPQQDLAAKRRLAGRGPRVKSSLEITPDGGAWLRLCDFNPSEEDARALHEVLARLPEMHDRPYIVFDLRGNDGGSSAWGEEAVKDFFGASALAQLQARSHDHADWRASAGNVAYLRGVLPTIQRNFGADSADAALVTRVIAGLEEALAPGQPVYQEPAEHPRPPRGQETTVAAAPLPASYRGKVFLLTDAWDASAALDFCDLLLVIAGVIQVGQPTSADSVYLDARWPVALPSGLGDISLPMKVYRDRRRGNNQPYLPALRWEGDITDTAALQRWVARLAKVPAPK